MACLIHDSSAAANAAGGRGQTFETWNARLPRPDRGAAKETRIRWTRDGDVRGTPVRAGDVLVVRGAGREIVGVDRGSGSRRWTNTLTIASGFVSASRLAVDDNVAVAGEDALEAFDVRTGARLWTSGPEVARGAGVELGGFLRGAIVAGSYASRIQAVDGKTGALRWSLSVAAPSSDPVVVFPPGIGDDLVAATFASAGSDAASGLVASDADGRLLWRTMWARGQRRALVGRPVVTASLVLATDRSGAIHAFARSDGRPLWTIDGVVTDDREDFRPLVVTGGVLVAGSLTGRVVAYDLATQTERWRTWPLESSVAFTMAAEDDVIWVPFVSGRVLAIRIGDGVSVRQLGSDDGFRWVPAWDESSIYAAGGASGLVAFAREGGSR